MLLLFAIAGAIGLLLGVLFRTPALVAACFVVTIVAVAFGFIRELSLLDRFCAAVGSLVALQVAYLVGAWIGGSAPRK